MIDSNLDHGIQNSDTLAAKAKPHLVAIVVCSIYILTVSILYLASRGFRFEAIPVYALELCLIYGTVQVLRNIRKGVIILATTAKISVVAISFFNLVGLTVFGRNWCLALAWVSIAAMGYLAVVDVIPALRTRAGISPISSRGMIIRIASFTLPIILLFTVYLVVIFAIVPKEARELRTLPYDTLLESYGFPEKAEYRWEDEFGIYLRKDLSEKELPGGDMTLWIDGQGYRVFHHPGAMGAEIAYVESGFGSPYEFEKGVWNAGVFQMVPLILKAIAMPKTGTMVYHLEAGTFNTIIITGKLEDGRGSVQLHIHPANEEPYSMNIVASSLAEAVEPVILTVEKLTNE